MKVYQVEYNDVGQVCVAAESYSEAEKKFLNSWEGGDDVNIKKIILINNELIN